MTGSELIAYTRTLLADSTEPYLWSDDFLLTALQEAERLFCMRTHLNVVEESVTTAADSSTYALPENTLKVVFAHIDDTPVDRLTAPSSTVYLRSARGKPTGYVTGFPTRNVTFYPTPDAAYIVDLIIAALPEEGFGASDDPVVPAEWQLLLADFAAHKALITNDVDGNNVGTATTFMQRWELGVLEAKRMDYLLRTSPRAPLRSWTGGKR
jgi:hypothetical protein